MPATLTQVTEDVSLGNNSQDEQFESDDQDQELLLGQHDDDEDINGLLDDTGFWEAEAVAILQPFKEEWCNGDRSDDVVIRAVEALQENGLEKYADMKKSVKLWLQRRALMRSKYGPGHTPSLRTIVAFYKAKEIAEAVETWFKDDPSLGKKQRIGVHANEVSKLMRELLLPSQKDNLTEMEAKRKLWTKKGPPMAVRRL